MKSKDYILTDFRVESNKTESYQRSMLELVADIRDVLVSLKEEDNKWNKETK